jgi:predicted RNA-binding Zn-ribbon protein involved in translation (DUF1610 family)
MTATIQKIGLCSSCHYPIEVSYEGQVIACPYCGTVNRAITQVKIPTSVFVGFISFLAGAILGPSLWAATKAGSEALGRLAREHIK